MPECPDTKYAPRTYCASQPSIVASLGPTSKRATQRNHQDKKYQTDPNSPNRFQINDLPTQDFRSPVARISVLRSAAFPAPAAASPPKKPTQPNSPNRCTKRTQFPPPATTPSAAPAPARPPRPAFRPAPAPKRQNRTTKQTQSRRTHRNQRLSQHPTLTCHTPPGVPCRHSWRQILPAQPHNVSLPHPPPIAKLPPQTSPIPLIPNRRVTTIHSRQINNIPPKPPKTLDSPC